MRLCRRHFTACLMGGGWASRLLALPPRPKLLVLIVLEQFRPDYVDSVWPQLGSGGLRQILSRGAYFPDCRHLASTFPATALATLSTGAWPAQHGIVAESWYARGSHAVVQASEEGLLATTLADQVAADPHRRVFVVAMNAAHAGLLAGTPQAQVYWMDGAGRFATRGEPRDWISDFNAQNSPEDAHDVRWMALGARVDAPPLRTLAYDPVHPQEFLTLYKASPLGQTTLFDFAGEVIARERLGQGDTFDLLCLVDGSTALLGYETGALSPLMQQMTLQLDRRLETLLAQLKIAPGEGAYDLVLAAAHGAPPNPPEESRPRMAVDGEALARTLDRSLSAANPSTRIEKYLYPFLYLNAGSAPDAETVRQAAARAALDQPAVAGYYTARGACSTENDWERRFRNSFHPARSGDLMLSYRPGYVEAYGQNRGISYGSLYNYDVRVPLCFFGPQFRAGTFEQPVETVDIAPTLARAMGVAAPSSSMGRVLGEAFAG
jgi:hypothetical protein